MTVHINANGVPNLKSGEWALILKNEGDAQPYMIAFGCPCGQAKDDFHHRYNVSLHITPPGQPKESVEDHPAWEWDGNWEAPTLTPSIQRQGACNWHGHLKKGVFESV